MRDVAVVAFAQSKHERRIEGYNEIEMMMPVVGELWERTGLSAKRAVPGGGCGERGERGERGPSNPAGCLHSALLDLNVR